MIRYIVCRLLQAGVTLLLISICIFFMLNAAPGGPIYGLVMQQKLSAEKVEQLKEEYGLNESIPIRYVKWLIHVIRGDLGYSFITKRQVMNEILDRLRNTIYLMLITFIIVIGISIPIGATSALKQYSTFDIIVTNIAYMGQAMPEFWLGIIFLHVFYGTLINPLTGKPLLPSGGMYTLGESFNIIDRIIHLILPVSTLAITWISWYSRFLRSSMLEIIHQDYITTARAKGLSEHVVIFRHVLKNAMFPLITLVALDLPYLFSGALYVEIIFSWPGMGRLFYESATQRDYPVLMGILMIISLLFTFCNILADITYVYIDPRVNLEKDSS